MANVERANGVTHGVGESGKKIPGAAPNRTGFFLGPCYTVPPNFLETGMDVFAQSCLVPEDVWAARLQ